MSPALSRPIQSPCRFRKQLTICPQAIPQELSARGYRRQLCVDFSPVVVQLMRTRHRDLAGVEWKLMDVRDMAAIPDRSVYIAFDKGTLDSMIHGSPWTPPDDVRESTARYMKEVGRVLEDNGVFLCISFRQPHFVKPLLSQGGAWDIDVEVVGDEGHFGYQAFIMKKHTAGSRAGRCVEAEV